MSGDDDDFGPRPRGRAGAEIGSRRALLIVVVVAVLAVVAFAVVRHLRGSPATCATGGSVACGFADAFTIRGYHRTSQTVGRGRTDVTTYYVGPAAPELLPLIAAPGLTLAPPASPGGTSLAPLIGVGSSADPRYARCAVFAYQIKPPGQRGFAGSADSAGVASGALDMVSIGLTCVSA